MDENLRYTLYLDSVYDRNNGRKLRKQKVVDLESLKKFKQEIESFFPQDGKWYSTCFNKPKDLAYNNLPCHLRDIDWMSRLLYQGLGGAVSRSSIKKFMATSADFAKLRHDYELFSGKSIGLWTVVKIGYSRKVLMSCLC